MKVFLTGGTGFIGSHVLKELLDLDIEVIAHKRKKSSTPKIKINKTINWLTKPIENLKVDDFKGVDILIHLASHSVQYPFDTLDNNILFNVLNPLKMFYQAKLAGVNKLLIAGSCSEYGISGNNYDYIPTNAPLLPMDSYASSKAMGFLSFRQFSVQNNLIFSYQRIFHTYGEGEAENRLWPSLKKAAINGDSFEMTLGEQIRDFIKVEELAKKLIEECMRIHTINNAEIIVKNVGTGKGTSLKEFSEYWWKRWGASGRLNFGAIPYRENEIMRLVPDLN